MRKWESWPATRGSPVETRSVEQPLTKVKFRGFGGKRYVVECLAEYAVSGKRYSGWARADQGTDVLRLADELRTCPFLPSYTVHYDPQEPSTAHAFIAGPASP